MIALLIAGTVKGLVGMGLPLTALGLITLFIDPRQGIAFVMIPMLASNAWQVWRAGHIWDALKRYLPFAVALAGSVGIAVFAFSGVSDSWIYAGLGGTLLVYVAISLRNIVPDLPDRHDRAAQIVAGLASGISGGLTSVWAPPMAMYLAARGVGKDEFVRASGLLILLGSIPFAVGYAALGFLDRPSVLLGLGLLVPTFAGFRLGEILRGRLSEAGFKKALLAVFVLIGLNLIRKAIWG